MYKKLKELFDSRDKKSRLSHISNLVALARVDGTLESSELSLIFKIGLRSGLTHREVERIFERPSSIKFIPPANDKEKFEQLYDLVLVTKVNGEIHENELSLCRHMAEKLGIRQGSINIILQHMIHDIEEGVDFELEYGQLSQMEAGK